MARRTRNISIGTAIVGGIVGSIMLIGSGGGITQDNSNLFWDNGNSRLGIGTNAPGKDLHVNTTSGTGPVLFLTNVDTGVIVGSDGLELGIDVNENAFLWNYEPAGEL